jgi:hypothetical protein
MLCQKIGIYMIYGNYSFNSTLHCPNSLLETHNSFKNIPKKEIMKHFGSFHKHASLLAQDSKHCKIPTISHHIWLTNVSKPKEMRNDDFNNLNNTINILDRDTSSNWQHIFWTNCKTCIPLTVKRLAQLNIETRELGDFQNRFTSYDIVIRLLNEDSAYGMAADIIREDIVLHFGGFYSDLNYIIHRSPENLMERYNFLVDEKAENYMFAASPSNPILKLAFETTMTQVLKLSNMGEKISGCSTNEITHTVTYGIFANVILENLPYTNSTYFMIPINDSVIYRHETNCNTEVTFTKSGVLLMKCISTILSQEEELNRIDAIPRLLKCQDHENPSYNTHTQYPWKCFENAEFGSDGKKRPELGVRPSQNYSRN